MTLSKYVSEAMKIYYETFDKAVTGEIKSCFNCKHSIFHPPVPESFYDPGTDAEAECTHKEVEKMWDAIDAKVQQHPHYEYGLEHYTAIHCPFYEAMTDEEREKRFWDYLYDVDALMKKASEGK